MPEYINCTCGSNKFHISPNAMIFCCECRNYFTLAQLQEMHALSKDRVDAEEKYHQG